jgi:hypothetical protein
MGRYTRRQGSPVGITTLVHQGCGFTVPWQGKDGPQRRFQWLLGAIRERLSDRLGLPLIEVKRPWSVAAREGCL